MKAWIYSVLNPLAEVLRAENKLLSKQNLTWRYRTAGMEFILLTRDLIQPSARPNYDDLLQGRPDLKPAMNARDERVRTLGQAALACWTHLTQYSPFRQIVAGQLKQWKEEGNPYPGGGVSEEEFWLLIAEYLMNNVEELPYHYSSRAFWSRFRQIFLASRAGSPFSQLEKSISDLQQLNESLIETLDQTRSNLCEQYDIPAAPI
jgi:hypothetical protein